MLKVVKVRLYPNREQKQLLEQSFGNCRFLWNYCLDLMNKTYKETGKGLSGYEVKKQIPSLKKEYEWLKLTYSQCLQQVCLNLGVAFKNFFERRAGYPSFKSKHGKQSIHYPQNVKVLDGSLKLPSIGEVKAIIHRPISGKVKTVTVSKNRCDQYFASVLFEEGKGKPESSAEGKAVGIDLGLTHFAITSDGSKFDNPRWLNKHKQNLKCKQQQLSRKPQGSNNRNKARKKVARVHNKISRCREDFHHKLSLSIVNENQVIVVENLAVKNMVKNHCLAKAISQVGWGQFCTMLKYKAEQEGKIYQEVDRFFPSSKTCHVCLNQVGSLPLDIRHWTCTNCGSKHDRDVNAAINIRDRHRLRILTSGTGDKAYRQTVRRSNRGRKKSTTTLVCWVGSPRCNLRFSAGEFTPKYYVDNGTASRGTVSERVGITPMSIPCQIVVEGNPAIIYASRNGAPDKVRRILKPFLGKFCQEREAAGEYHDTPECLVAQIVVRFGFEICEDDFSNLKVSMTYDPNAEYIYSVESDLTVQVWIPEEEYRKNPAVGLKGCRLLPEEGWKID